MTGKFNCPYCGQKLEAEREWIGEQTECPNCRKRFDIPAPPPPKAVCWPSEDPSSASKAPPPRSRSGGAGNGRFIFICPECGEASEMSERKLGQSIDCPFCGETVTVTRTETRSCPKCGEEIKINAVVCKHCRRRIPPLRPHSAVGRPDGGAHIPPTRSCGNAADGVDAESTEKLFRNYNWMFPAGMAGMVFVTFLVFICIALDNEASVVFGVICLVIGLPMSALLLAAVVTQFMLLYRYWKLIPDEPDPLQKVLFLLIPFFNLYWVFRAYAELGKRLENETGSGGANSAALLGMVCAITFVAGTVLAFVPFAGWVVSPMTPFVVFLTMRAFHKEARLLMS